jgi:LysR family transcriptional regulator, low CO2-responsive transcriptional regulator
VAQCGTISTAAKQLHLSQPVVTAHLQRLKEIMGKPLVSRPAGTRVKVAQYEVLGNEAKDKSVP